MGREFFICEDAAFVTPVCPRLVFSNAVFAHLLNSVYSLDPMKMSRNSVCPRQVSHFCGLHKSPALDNALSSLLSCCSQHFSCSLCLYIFFRWSRSVTTTVSKSQRRQAFAYVGSFNTKNFFSEGQKNLVNSENKENLSNYQLLKRNPSVFSTSLYFSKLITVVQFFFPVTPVTQWFSIKFLLS